MGSLEQLQGPAEVHTCGPPRLPASTGCPPHLSGLVSSIRADIDPTGLQSQWTPDGEILWPRGRVAPFPLLPGQSLVVLPALLLLVFLSPPRWPVWCSPGTGETCRSRSDLPGCGNSGSVTIHSSWRAGHTPLWLDCWDRHHQSLCPLHPPEAQSNLSAQGLIGDTRNRGPGSLSDFRLPAWQQGCPLITQPSPSRRPGVIVLCDTASLSTVTQMVDAGCCCKIP
nr:uncharacterized protein LOC119622779 [Chlorocebus sabaeus]